MSTTALPEFNPISKRDKNYTLYIDMLELLTEAQGDSDKAGETDAVCWYDGQVNILTWALCQITNTEMCPGCGGPLPEKGTNIPAGRGKDCVH